MGRLPRALLLMVALAAAGCGIIAGTGDFTDQPGGGGSGGATATSSGTGNGTSSSSGSGASASSGMMAGGQGGAGAGTGGDGGATCLDCSTYVNQCYIQMGQSDCTATPPCEGEANMAFNALASCVCRTCPNDCATSCTGSSPLSEACKTCAAQAANNPDACQTEYSSCQQAGG